MARINLLPWREERRKQRQQEFYVILAGAALIGGLLFLSIHWYIGELQDAQDRRNQKLTDEIAQLDRSIREIEELEAKRSRILARKQVIEELQKSRSQIVHLFDELVRTIPDGVRLSDLKQQGNRLTLTGVAESNAKVSAYMRSLEASDWMKEPDLSITETTEEDDRIGRYNFSLSVTVINKDADEEDSYADEEVAQ